MLWPQDTTKGFGAAAGFKPLQSLANGKVAGLPAPFVLLIVIAAVMWVVLHRSVYGRYLYAAGRNEEAARFSGINTRRASSQTTYVIGALLTGVSGVLFVAFYTNPPVPALDAGQLLRALRHRGGRPRRL